MKAEDRHKFILNRLRKSDYVDVAELSDILNVSEMTVRRDLARLENEQSLLRVHGGARRIPTYKLEASLNSRLLENREEKETIGRYAASLVEDGDIIVMDGSSTVYFMVSHLQDKKITVITNNLSVAMGFIENKNVNIILLGGNLNKIAHYTYGCDVIEKMKNYNTNKAFFSSNSIDVQRGVMDVSVVEGETKRAMISSADESFLLMDSSKFGTKSYYNVMPTKKIDHIITSKTDNALANNVISELRNIKNIKIHIC